MPGFDAGRPRGNKGSTGVEEIIAVMRETGDKSHGRRLRGLIVVMRRAGLRIQEALALTEPISIRAVAPPTCGAPRRAASVRRRFAPHQHHFRVPAGQAIDSGEIIETVHAGHAPMIPVSASLRL